MRHRRKAALIGLCCALIGGISIGAVADAKKKGPKPKYFGTKVALTYTDNLNGPDTFTGVVTSPKQACVGGRRVEIIPETGNIELPALAQTISNPDGTFTVTAEHEKLRPYYAYVARKKLSGGGDRKRYCKADLGGRVVTPG